MRLLTENWGWKLLALLVSTVLWFTFVGETELAASLPTTVQFQNVPNDLEVSADTLDRLFVRLRGPATRLNPGSLRDVSVVLDLSNIHSPGERTFSLTNANLRLPPGVEVSQVVPSHLKLTFERRITRDVPVQARFAGEAPPGYRITGQTPSPARVRVTGPASHVESLQHVLTNAIDLSATVGNAEFRVQAFLPDPQVRFEGEPPIISVRVLMEKVGPASN